MKKILYLLLLCGASSLSLFAQNIGMQNDFVTIDQQNYLRWDGQLTKVSVCTPNGTEFAFLQLDDTRKSYDILFANGSRAHWTPESSASTRKSFAKDIYNAGVLLTNGTINNQALATFVQQHAAPNPNVVFERPAAPIAQTVEGMVMRNRNQTISLQNNEIYQDGAFIGKYTTEIQKLKDSNLHVFSFSFTNGNAVAYARFFDKTNAIGIMTVKDSGRTTLPLNQATYLQDIVKFLVDNNYL